MSSSMSREPAVLTLQNGFFWSGSSLAMLICSNLLTCYELISISAVHVGTYDVPALCPLLVRK